MVQVKGSTLVPRVHYLRSHGTPEQQERVLAELSPECRHEIEDGLLLNQWYPLDYFTQLCRALDKIYGRGDLTLIPEIAGLAAAETLNTIYKVFYKVGSPEFIINRASRVWSQYYNSGRLEVVRIGPKQIKLLLHEFETPAREHCLSVLGWIEKTLEMSGGKHIRVTHSQCRLQRGAVCEYTAVWE